MKGVGGISRIEEVIRREQDPFVLGTLCATLGADCGTAGQLALGNLMAEEVTRRREPYILGTAIHMAKVVPAAEAFYGLLECPLPKGALADALNSLRGGSPFRECTVPCAGSP